MAQKAHNNKNEMNEKQRRELEKIYSLIEQIAREAKYRHIGA